MNKFYFGNPFLRWAFLIWELIFLLQTFVLILVVFFVVFLATCRPNFTWRPEVKFGQNVVRKTTKKKKLPRWGQKSAIKKKKKKKKINSQILFCSILRLLHFICLDYVVTQIFTSQMIFNSLKHPVYWTQTRKRHSSAHITNCDS